MKRFWSWTLFVVWTALAIYVGLRFASELNITSSYTGTSIKFSTDTDHLVLIESNQTVQVDAASDQFFVLRKLSGETVIATPQIAPIGWIGDAYYKAGPAQIPGGKWIVSEGAPVIQITSSQPIMVRVVVTDSSAISNDWSAGIVLLMCWLLGLMVLAALKVFD